MERHRPQCDPSRSRSHCGTQYLQGGDQRGGARDATPSILLGQDQQIYNGQAQGQQRDRDRHPVHLCVKELILKENGTERITVEVFTTGDYKIIKSDITDALKDIGLIITSGKNEVHQPAMAPTCPLISNKMIIRVTPPGHTSLKDGKLTLRDAAHAFRWPKNLMVKILFQGEDEPHRIQLRYKVYGDGLLDGELELCRICHKYKEHLRNCPNRQAKKRNRKAKMFEFSRKIVEENKSGNQCGWFALGLCFHQRECRLAHNKEPSPGHQRTSSSNGASP